MNAAQQRQQQGIQQQQQQDMGDTQPIQPEPMGLKLASAGNIDLSNAEGNDRRTRDGKWTLAQLRATEGICPLQNGTNQFDSQKKMTSFGTPRDVKGKHLKRIWELEFPEEAELYQRPAVNAAPQQQQGQFQQGQQSLQQQPPQQGQYQQQSQPPQGQLQRQPQGQLQGGQQQPQQQFAKQPQPNAQQQQFGQQPQGGGRPQQQGQAQQQQQQYAQQMSPQQQKGGAPNFR